MNAALTPTPLRDARLRVRVRGLVQGVGFRPFVFALAERFGLTGYVLNDDAGVLLEVQGTSRAVEALVHALSAEAPPLSRVEGIEVERLPLSTGNDGRFAIRESTRTARVSTGIVADAAPCRACLAELFDPRDRRYRYPFLNCTHCGPRFSITRALPYDRAQTSMAPFAMCAPCAREYADPRDRRFHAQPTACPACGPKLSCSLEEIVERLRAGAIVAIKAVGGYQLACSAHDEAAVARLRARKERAGKPFAVMVASRASAERLVELSPAAASLLESAERPIVLARRHDALAASVAPDLAWLGVMLPASPLHYALFHEAAGRPCGLDWLEHAVDFALVMTSANPGGEPLVIDDDQALQRLRGIADLVVSHDRAIVIRCDDPVVRAIGESDRTVTVRRGRGQVPRGITLSRSVPSVLATGAFLKNAICLTRGDRAFLSQHVGDMDDAQTFRFFRETVAHLESILETEPEAVAHDLHPDFLSTRFAERLGVRAIAVQHHHAHVAAVLAEHRREGPHFGLALDGVGLGTDGHAWGGELLRVDGAHFERVGHLMPLPLPGGDAAAHEPWRMAASVLWKLGDTKAIVERWGERGARLVPLLERSASKIHTTGCGRYFDAACALLGVRDQSGYEGEAPMVLESLVRAPRVLPNAWRIHGSSLDLLPLFDALRTMDARTGADVFHGTLAAAWVDFTLRAIGSARTVILSGGCIVNAALTQALIAGFAEHGVDVLLPREAPAGDGGLALGQAWIAAQSSIGGN